MKLIECKACGGSVSKKAKNCPHCGEPMDKGLSAGKLLLILIIGSIFAIPFLSDIAPSNSSSVKEIQKPVIASPKTQEKREKLIQQLLNEGVFYKVEGGSISKAYVTNTFYGLNIDDKKVFVEMVFAYYYETETPINYLALIDSLSGKEIGSFTLIRGLRLE